jgi:hypothetical protein
MGKWPIGKENEQRAESLKKLFSFYLIVAKNFSKIFFVPFNSGGRNAFSRLQLDLTFGDFCPPTLTLPLGGGREGWG